jgi:integrase
MAKFTAVALVKLWKEGKPASHADNDCRNLRLNVTGPNAANWSFRYQLNGRRHEPGLGAFPELGLAAARAKADTLRKQVRIDKIDPLEHRKSERSKAVAQTAKDITVGELWEQFYDDQRNKAKKWSRRTAYNYQICMNNVLPNLEKISARDVDTPLLRKLLEPIAEEKFGVAERIENLLGQLLEYAAFHNYGGRRGLANPARGILKYLGTKKEGGHRRAYPYQQMPQFMAKLREFQEPRPCEFQKPHRAGLDRAAIAAARAGGMSWRKIAQEFEISRATASYTTKTHIDYHTVIQAYAFEAMILTGPPRSCEIVNTLWTEFDRSQEVVIMPRSRMKVKRGRNGHPYIAPATKRVLEIFDLMETMKCGDYVFPGSTHGRKSKSKDLFAIEHPSVTGYPLGRNALLDFLRKKMGIHGVDVHGFRKTFKNWARNRGFDPELIELSLDHAYGSQIERVYQDDQLVERRREMLEAWADFCNGSPAEIIRLPMHKRKAG